MASPYELLFFSDRTNKYIHCCSMDAPKDYEVIINLKLLKLCRYFGLIDQNGKKILGYNIDRLIFTISVCFVQIIAFYSNLGFFVNVDYKLSTDEFFLILFADVLNYLTFFKTCFFFYRVNNVVELLDVTRLDFLMSILCRKNNKILYVYRDLIKKYSNYYNIFTMAIVTQWISFAYLRHVFFEDENIDRRRWTNILSMPYPIKTHVFNEYYNFIFAIELIAMVFTLYSTLMIDTFLFSYGWIITLQYEILGLAFKDLGYKKNRLSGNNILIFFFQLTFVLQ